MELIRASKYIRHNWKFDLVAGTTVAIVALPLALGFGVTSGAGAASGLATAIIAGFVAALLGGSRFQVSGPTGAMTVILVPIIASFGSTALFALGVMAGLIVVAMGVLKLGRFVEKIPWSVMEGFTLGIALIIALQQLPLIFQTSRGKGERTLDIAGSTITEALGAAVNWLSIGLVVLTLLVKVIWSRVQKLIHINIIVPPSAVAVLLVSILVWATNLPVAKIGSLPVGEIFHFSLALPEIPLQLLLYPAFAIALLGAIESLLAARVADAMAHKQDSETKSHHKPNQELIGQGLATVASSMFGGMPATGAIARTGVNVYSGAKSGFASATHALVLLGMVLFLSPLVSEIPMAALAGVLLGTSWRIASPQTIKEALQTDYSSRVVYLTTAAAVLSIDLIWGLAIGIAVHIVLEGIKSLRGKSKE